MELRGMVVVNGMAQLVDNDEIAQMLRKRHQEKAQRNVVRPGTAPPLRTRGTDRQLVVLQPRDAGEPTDTVGQVGLAARRSSSTRAFSAAGGNCGGSAARRCASRARAASTHPALHSRNSIARRAETPQGNDRRTHPVPRTLIEIRRARRDWERTTSPSRGCSTVVIMPNGP